MYKKQMTVQRILCVGMLIVCAVIFLYSLGIMTDLYDALYNTIRNPEKLEKTTVTGSRIYYDMQGFNRDFLHASIGMLLLCVVLFLTNTHSRRKYYIGIFRSSTSRPSSCKSTLRNWRPTRRKRKAFTPNPPSGSTFITRSSACCCWASCC